MKHRRLRFLDHELRRPPPHGGATAVFAPAHSVLVRHPDESRARRLQRPALAGSPSLPKRPIPTPAQAQAPVPAPAHRRRPPAAAQFAPAGRLGWGAPREGASLHFRWNCSIVDKYANAIVFFAESPSGNQHEKN